MTLKQNKFNVVCGIFKSQKWLKYDALSFFFPDLKMIVATVQVTVSQVMNKSVLNKKATCRSFKN